MRRLCFPVLLLIVLLTAAIASAAEPARVEGFSPQGTVKGVRQVTARFSEAMVPFGDPREIVGPFEIDCSEKGTARWADPRNWVYDFDRDLPAGVRCDFHLKTGLKSLSGKEIGGQSAFSFTTGGPAILVQSSYPYEGSEQIDEEQVFLLRLDAEPDLDSVSQHAYFGVAGIHDRIGFRVIDGKERQRLLKVRRREDLPTFLLLQSRQRFPSGKEVSLVWGKGVRSKSGVATEEDQVLRFRTREPFSAEFHCDRENPRAGCIPILPMRLSFSSSIPREKAGKISLKGPDGKTWKVKMDEKQEWISSVTFEAPFPEASPFTVEIPAGLADDAGRSLTNQDKFPLNVRTDRYPPLAKFPARFGIVELKADPVLPVTLRNLEAEVKGRLLIVKEEKRVTGEVTGRALRVPPGEEGRILAWMDSLQKQKREWSLLKGVREAREISLPKPGGPRAFEVVGIPLKEPGFYIVELESRILGEALLSPPGPMYVPTGVLVTNLAVHFKWGPEASLVWVTTLDEAAPVPAAAVSVRNCLGKVLWEGKTDEAGLAPIRAALDPAQSCPGETGPFFVTARAAGDMAFALSAWDQGIEPWRFQLPDIPYTGPFAAHTVFDRSLLRAGEAVHMKHLFRKQTMEGFSLVASDKAPSRALIEQAGSEEKYELPLVWDSAGIAESTWTIPKEAKLGTYRVSLAGKEDGPSWESGQFRVEEFRVPVMKGVIRQPSDTLVGPGEIALDLSVRYLAGGGAANLPVRLRSEVRPGTVPSFEGYDGFTFSNGAVKEGVVRRGLALDSEEDSGETDDERTDREDRKGIRLPPIDAVLDSTGSGRAVLSGLPRVDSPKQVAAELEYRDPSGEIQTVPARIPLWPSSVLIGVRADAWAFSKERLLFHVSVLDLKGRPVSGARVEADLFERKSYSHRKRLVGGFYAYEHVTETKRIKAACGGRTDSRGLLLCETESPVSGNLIFEARTEDEKGNRAVARAEAWVVGKGEWWFEAENHDRIDLLPEKKRYEPGETARFQVRMPFREATALVTVEREGVIESWVKPLSGREPVIEVPVRGFHAPNVFVSVLVVRGRMSGVAPTALVDLGKPAFKLGIAEIQVGWKAHELTVKVTPEREVYRVREKAKVRVRVRTAEGKAPPRGSEIALAAVDEGLLELMPNRSWDLLPAMMGRRGYGVQTATAQMQVVGRRHFGLKALPPGGGGGRQTTRELFDTLLLWKGRVALDADGEASVEIPLNDSITGFRIVAVATAGPGLFGTGSAAIRSTQALMVFSGLPPLVRERDRFRSEFTLRNTTERTMEVEVSARVKGLAGTLTPSTVPLQPGEAKEAGWEVAVPAGVEALAWDVEVKEKNGEERDRLRVTQKVVPAVPVRTFQATLARLEKGLDLPVERPRDALPGRGGIQVTLKPRIAGVLAGVTEYMKSYPYVCMEQRLSMAVALGDGGRWEKCMADLPASLDEEGLVKYFPGMSPGSDVLTSYLLAIGHEASRAVPDGLRTRMEEGLRGFVRGKISRRSSLPTVDLTLRKLGAIEALSRYGKADRDMVNSITLEPNLWPTSAVIDWIGILRNVKDLPERDRRLGEAEQILRARLNFQGTTMGFSTESSDSLWWLMISGDVNAVKAILALLPSAGWREDLPRMVQGAIARQRKGAWNLTTANAWGVLAMEKFSAAFESVPVTGVTRSSLAGRREAVDWKAAPKGKGSTFPWPKGRDTLALSHEGSGSPWATVQSLAAIPLKEAFSSGYRIRKTVTPVERKQAGRWSRGDILRVRIEIEAQADQTWVVVSDPVPAGATLLGGGLGRDSELLTRGEERPGRLWPAFEERSFEAFRAYYEVAQKGTWTVEYTMRLNQSGLFQLPATRVEALYSPEMMGELPNTPLEVKP